MKILGISAYYHDSAAALINGTHIVAAAQEERFTRIKHDQSFPTHAIRYCLEESGYTIDELDAVVFYDKPLIKFERLLETYYGFAPKGLTSFIRSVPIWVKEKLFLKRNIRKGLSEIQAYDKGNLNLLFPEHHLSHSASAYYTSPYDDAAILTLDGVGEWATAALSHGKGNQITVLKELTFPHSLGLLYSAFTYFLGFKVNSGEYKMMGLAPYGNAQSEEYQSFYDTIVNELITVKEDGSIWLDQKYFNYSTGLRMVKDRVWEKLFGIRKRQPEEALTSSHMNLALAIQHITEDIVIKLARHVKTLTGSQNLCLAGGVALNCVANGKLHSAGVFDNIYIQPAAGDAGCALGAALAALHITYDQEKKATLSDTMQGAYLGPAFSSKEIEIAAKASSLIWKKHTEEEVCQAISQHLAEGKVVGWFQGRMEYGPRALGNRSILGDPRSEAMQRTLNLKIKFRESFRPFAPAVLAEDVGKYFDHAGSSPYMLMVKRLKEEQLKAIPTNYHSLPIREKLAVVKSDLPAITHVDFTGRIQTVHEETNPKFYALLKAFKALTGHGMVINTSFNVRGEPIVCTPQDAMHCFMNTDMDILVIEDYLFFKSEQTITSSREQYLEQFELD